MPSKFVLAKLVGALALATTATCLGLDGTYRSAPVVPGLYVVEFEEPSTLEVNVLDVSVKVDASAFYDTLSANKIAATPRLDLNYDLFKGASFRLDDKDDNQATLEKISALKTVKNVWPARSYTVPAQINSVGSVARSAVEALQKRSQGDSFSPHVLGRVDKLHKEGYTGEGIFIGVIDTGIDYNHPSLGGGFGPGFKVVAGTDLVGDNYNGTTTPVPDDDPMDCSGHGTHVAGIIAASENEYGFTGVAPNATLGIWRVFGCDGYTTTDILIQSFNLAYESGVDLISASIGGANGWTDHPWNNAVQRIAAKGVPCVLAAGNDGSEGLFRTSDASDSLGSTSIGSIDNTLYSGFVVDGTYTTNGSNGSSTKFSYAASEAGPYFDNETYPLYATNLTMPKDDACMPLPDSTPDLGKYIVLISRGVCDFELKVANAVAKGARRVLFYNNRVNYMGTLVNINITIPSGMTTLAHGQALINLLKQGTTPMVKLGGPIYLSTELNNDSGEKMSSYSSWGPTYELHARPHVSAPGGYILSTWPLKKRGYAVLSGTSMATPFTAGTIALLKQIKGKRFAEPKAITSLLSTTARPLKWNNSTQTDAFLAPVIQQGGGLIDAYAAAYATTVLDHDIIALNDTAHFKAAHDLKIQNNGKSAQTYTFENLIAATTYTFSNGSATPDLFPPKFSVDKAGAATVKFSPETLTVEAGEEATLQLIFTPPQGLDTHRLPIYSGYIYVNSTSGDKLTLPYFGVAGRMRDVRIIDPEMEYPFLATSNNIEVPTNMTSFTITRNETSVQDNATYPVINSQFAMGSRLVYFDIAPESNYTTLNTSTTNAPKGLDATSDKSLLWRVPETPVLIVTRGYEYWVGWNGTLADQSFAPAGKYKIVMRALKILGDETKEEDYERWDSPYFNIKY